MRQPLREGWRHGGEKENPAIVIGRGKAPADHKPCNLGAMHPLPVSKDDE